MNNGLKRCGVCGESKPSTSYYLKRDKYLDGQCKDCKRKYHKEHYRKNIDKEKIRSYEKYHNQSVEIRSRYLALQRDWSKSNNGVYLTYRKRAKKAGLDFSLSKDEFISFLDKNCFYCGCIARGIDRVNNTEGYVKDNCVSCCMICNRMKNKYSMQEFLNKCNQIIKHNTLRLNN